MFRYDADGHVDYPHTVGALDTCGHPDCVEAQEEAEEGSGDVDDLLGLASAIGDAVARGGRPAGL